MSFSENNRANKEVKKITRRDFLRKSIGTASGVALTSLLGSSGLAKAQEPVKIGCVYPLTGPLAKLGKESLRGTELAAKERNAAGGINGRKVKLIKRDAPDADAGVAVVESLATVKKVDVCVGSYSSTISYACTAKAAALNMPYWELGAISDPITERKLPNVFRTCSVASDFGINTAKMAHDLVAPALGKDPKELRLATLYEDGLYGTTVSKYTTKKTVDLGMKVVATEAYDKETTDLSSTIARLEKAEPDVIGHTGYMGDIILFWQQTKSLGVNWPCVIGEGAGYSLTEFYEGIGDDVIGLLNEDFTQCNTNPKWAPGIKEYRDFYEQVYGRPPVSGHSTMNYFGANVLFDVLAKANSFSVKDIEKAALTLDRPTGTSVVGYGVKFHPLTHQNQRCPVTGIQWQRDVYTNDIWYPKRADGTPIPYTIFPAEARLPGIEPKYIPLPTWEEREKGG